MPARLTTLVIDDLAGLEALAPAWRQLWRRCPSATPFQSPGWLLSWWRTFSPGEVASVAAWDENELVGLAPLYLERNGPRTRLLPIGIAVSDYLDFLVDAERATDICAALAGEMASIPFDCCLLADVPADGAAAHATAFGGRIRWIDHCACPVLQLSGDAGLASCVPARRRRQLRRARAAAARLGPVNIRARTDEPDAFLDELLRLHQRRWAGSGGGVLSDPAVVAFHRMALRQLRAEDVLRCWTLSIDDRPVSAYYGFLRNGAAYAYLGGFDPDYSAESPGSILIGHAIQEAIAAGAREYHFLRGREAYKYGWGAVDRWTRRCTWTKSAAA